MRLHERDVIAREQPLELVFRERKDRIGDLARPGEARRLQALDPQSKARLVPINLEKAVDPSHRQSSGQPEGRWPGPSSEEFGERALQNEGQPLGVRQLLRSGFQGA